MSREDVDLVRRSWEAWERGDMEAIFAFYDPDIVWDFSRASVNTVLSDEYHGHDGVRKFFRDWAGSFAGYYAHAEKFIDAGDGSVLVYARQGGRGKESGVEIDMPYYWQVYRVRDGRAVRVEVHSDESEALKSVGLSEQAMSRENLEVVRRTFEAYARGDVEAMLGELDQGVEWKQFEEPAPVYGRDGVREALRRWDETWHHLQVEAEEYIDAGEFVVVLIRFRSLGKVSGVPVEQATYHVFTVRDGKVARMVEYGPGERTEALAAVGLSAQAMSRENVEVDRATFKAWNAGDMDALHDLYSADIIMRHPEGWPEPGPFVGREAVMRQFEQLRETWDADAVEPIGDFIDVGDRVAVRIVLRGEGRGPEANIEMTNVVTVRNGRIVFIEFFWDHAEALEAMGVQEQAMSRENVEVARRVSPRSHAETSGGAYGLGPLA